MAKLKDYISEELVHLNVDIKDDKEILRFLAAEMNQKGYVKESFSEALIEREGYAPTGLRTDGVGVAIPHSDPQHVIRPCVAVATLIHPVSFHEMGTSDGVVDNVQAVFCIALNEGDDHLEVLQDIISLITEGDTIPRIVGMTSKEELISELVTFKV